MAKHRARNVSTLSQEQLQHKRNVDRKAQRALRERTKNRVQILEEEIADLRARMSGHSFDTEEEVAALRKENMILKSTLGRIGHLASSIGSSDVTARSVSQSEVGHDEHTNVNIEPAHSTGRLLRSSSRPPAAYHAHEPDPSVDHNSSRVNSQVVDADLVSASDMPDTDMEAASIVVRDNAPSLDGNPPAFTHTKRPSLGLNLHQNGISPFLEDMVHTATTKDDYLDGTRAVTDYSTSPQVKNTPQSSTTTHVSNPVNHDHSTVGVWTFLPKHSQATCPLDQILLDFLATRRSMSGHGVAIESVLGPKEPSVLGLISPSLAFTVHPVSRVMAEVLTTFPNVAITEKIGFMYKMHRTMRWQIEPTEENYRAMPRWSQPTATQLTVPHAAWVDNIPWPSVRDMLIQQSELYPFALFSELYSQNVSVNWPYEVDDAVLKSNIDGRADAVLNPIFEKHIRKLSNWTVSKHFENQMPEMYSAIYSRD